MAISDEGQFQERVDPGGARDPMTVLDWHLENRKAAAMDSGDELPPKSLVHLTHLRPNLIDHSFPGEHVRTTGIMHRDVVEKLP